MEKKGWLNDYKILNFLGNGAFGEVYKVREHDEDGTVLYNPDGTYKEYVMKKVEWNFVWDKEKASRPMTLMDNHKLKEIDVMLNLHNPHLVHLHEVIEDPEAQFLYLILHFYQNGDLQKIIDNANKLAAPAENRMVTYRSQVSFEQIRQWSHHLVSALYTCHI